MRIISAVLMSLFLVLYVRELRQAGRARWSKVDRYFPFGIMLLFLPDVVTYPSTLLRTINLAVAGTLMMYGLYRRSRSVDDPPAGR